MSGTKKKDDKSPSVKKDAVKDLKVQPTKQGDVKGGVGGRSKPKTPCDPGCTPC